MRAASVNGGLIALGPCFVGYSGHFADLFFCPGIGKGYEVNSANPVKGLTKILPLEMSQHLL